MAEPAYSEADRARGQRLMILEGAFSRSMDSFTGGVVLAALALSIGAGDASFGLLAAIPFLAQLVHLPAIALLARWRDHRAITVYAAGGARLLLVPIAALPFLDPALPRVAILVALLVAYAVLAALSGAAWQVWMRDLIPREKLGAYHGRRFAALAVVGFAALVAAGQIIAWWRDHGAGGRNAGFAALYVTGAILGLASAWIMSRVPSQPSAFRPGEGFVASLRRPLASSNYRRVLVFLAAWGFAANLALPFVSIVLLTSLGYGLGTVTILAALSAIANFGGFRLWAPITDRFGAKPVLALSAAVFVFAMLAWAGLPKTAAGETGVLAAAAALHVLLGFSNAGLELGATTLVMKLAPPDEAAAYLSTTSMVKAVATGLAPLAGGLLAASLAANRFSVDLAWAGPSGVVGVTALEFAHYDFLFLASGLLGLYAAHRLLGFTEPGEAPTEEVVRAMRRDWPSLSSVAGMRQFSHMASYLVGAAHLRERKGSGPQPERPGKGET